MRRNTAVLLPLNSRNHSTRASRVVSTNSVSDSLKKRLPRHILGIDPSKDNATTGTTVNPALASGLLQPTDITVSGADLSIADFGIFGSDGETIDSAEPVEATRTVLKADFVVIRIYRASRRTAPGHLGQRPGPRFWAASNDSASRSE
jgi:hypothetical protein